MGSLLEMQMSLLIGLLLEVTLIVKKTVTKKVMARTSKKGTRIKQMIAMIMRQQKTKEDKG